MRSTPQQDRRHAAPRERVEKCIYKVCTDPRKNAHRHVRSLFGVARLSYKCAPHHSESAPTRSATWKSWKCKWKIWYARSMFGVARLSCKCAPHHSESARTHAAPRERVTRARKNICTDVRKIAHRHARSLFGIHFRRVWWDRPRH